MNCPRCGHEMVLDSHRRIPQLMCYECGYIEGRTYDDDNFSTGKRTNFTHLKELNFNEVVGFIATGLGVDEGKISSWLAEEIDD